MRSAQASRALRLRSGGTHPRGRQPQGRSGQRREPRQRPVDSRTASPSAATARDRPPSPVPQRGTRRSRMPPRVCARSAAYGQALVGRTKTPRLAPDSQRWASCLRAHTEAPAMGRAAVVRREALTALASQASRSLRAIDPCSGTSSRVGMCDVSTARLRARPRGLRCTAAKTGWLRDHAIPARVASKVCPAARRRSASPSPRPVAGVTTPARSGSLSASSPSARTLSPSITDVAP